MKTEIKIKPFNGKFDLFIMLDGTVVHVENFKSLMEIEDATERLVENARTAKIQATALAEALNARIAE